MTDSWDDLTALEQEYLGELLVEAHDLRRTAAECDQKARAQDRQRDTRVIECELRLDAIRGVLSASGIPEGDWLGWECDTVVLGGPAKLRAALDTRLFGKRHPTFDRYDLVGVLDRETGMFTSREAWEQIHDRPEVDGEQYRWVYERQEF